MQLLVWEKSPNNAQLYRDEIGMDDAIKTGLKWCHAQPENSVIGYIIADERTPVMRVTYGKPAHFSFFKVKKTSIFDRQIKEFIVKAPHMQALIAHFYNEYKGLREMTDNTVVLLNATVKIEIEMLDYWEVE